MAGALTPKDGQSEYERGFAAGYQAAFTNLDPSTCMEYKENKLLCKTKDTDGRAKDTDKEVPCGRMR